MTGATGFDGILRCKVLRGRMAAPPAGRLVMMGAGSFGKGLCDGGGVCISGSLTLPWGMAVGGLASWERASMACLVQGG